MTSIRLHYLKKERLIPIRYPFHTDKFLLLSEFNIFYIVLLILTLPSSKITPLHNLFQ